MGYYQEICGLFLGLNFTVYNNSNPLQTSKLDVSQICLLSELALIDFNIQYHLGKTNKAAGALKWHPIN